MANVTDLVTHLHNLSKANVKQITLDVAYLLEVLGEPVPSVKKQPTQPTQQYDVDGGTFNEE